MQVVVNLGITPKELENQIKMPESLTHCWQWFIDLNATRPAGFGISPITYSEIQAYFSLLQIQSEPWEVEVIKIFDRVALEVAAEQQAKEDKKNKNKNKK